MKKILFLTVLCFSFAVSFAQVPLGMRYQAVARDLKGQTIADKAIELKITLLNSDKTTYYTETHAVTTNELGLFNLVIGTGEVTSGEFKSIPWSKDEIWMEVAIRDKGEKDFFVISSSKLLTVPYAFHAGTADELSKPAEIRPTTGINTKEGDIDRCYIKDGVTMMKLLYLGPSGVQIKAYFEAPPKRLFSTYNNVQNGDIITVDARTGGEMKFKAETFLEVNSAAVPLTIIPTKGEPSIVSEIYNNFSVMSVLAYNKDASFNTECSVCDVPQFWKIGGNVMGELCNRLGSKNRADMTFGTNNIERMRIDKDGDINIKNTLGIDKNLNVGMDVRLNTVSGSTISNGPFIVNNSSPSTLTGSLEVKGTSKFKDAAVFDKSVEIKGTIDVAGKSKFRDSVTMDKTLNVTDALAVTGKSRFQDSSIFSNTVTVGGAFDVTGRSRFRDLVTFDKSVAINDQLSVKNFLLKGSDADFVATIENSYDGEGDGLIIKLGKTHPGWKTNENRYLNVPSPAVIFDEPLDKIRGWVYGTSTFKADDLLSFVPNKFVGAMACNLVNKITDRLNSALSLPVHLAVTMPGLSLGSVTIWHEAAIFDQDIIPKIPEIDCSGLPTVELPTFSFVNVQNSLNNENQFIKFSDKDNRQVGSIRAQSVQDFAADYLDGAYFINMMAGMIGIDFINGVANLISGYTDIAKAYNEIGVEYSSGAGDYAEWLEREDVNEVIAPGDIVGLKSGKISKNLKGAEQLMVVSHNPIVLGNSPAEGKEKAGNKIAFIGQVPVKVLGPVNAGDYIVAKGEITGYGTAVHPNQLTLEDSKLSIGRSWETNLNMGPKMVKTLVGVDNGNYFQVLKKNKDAADALQKKSEQLEKRMQMLEAQMNMLIKKPTSKFINKSRN